jgi:hypothetical protein
LSELYLPVTRPAPSGPAAEIPAHAQPGIVQNPNRLLLNQIEF